MSTLRLAASEAWRAARPPRGACPSLVDGTAPQGAHGPPVGPEEARLGGGLGAPTVREGEVGGRTRCGWCGVDPLYVAYHDREWGVPERDSRALFNKLVLDGFQAGLSWLTILRRREGILAAFHGLDPEWLARVDDDGRARLLADRRIIRSPAKVAAAIRNARAYLDMQDAGIDFAGWLWAFVGGRARAPRRRLAADVPTTSPESDRMARALRERKFAYVGPIICYALMQATGMVNDHLLSCFRRNELLRG